MSAELPAKRKKRSRSFTDVDNTFVKNVTSRVSGLLPSIITKWFGNPSSSNTNSSATVAESSDSSTEDEAPGTSTQSAKRVCYAFECECRSPSPSNIRPEMKCTSTNTESIETFSAVQSPIGQSTFNPETHFVTTTLLSPKEETSILEHKNSTPVHDLHTPFSGHSCINKRKSLYGELFDDKLLQSNSFWGCEPYLKPGEIGSPFYPGKTRYGGAASSYSNRPNIKYRKDVLTRNSANNDCNDSAVSHVTKRVMDILENYSSPLIEAKRISQFSRSHIDSLDNTIENNAYKAQELYVPKIAKILNLKQRAKLMGTTSAARQLIASNSSSPAFKPYPSLKNNSNNLKTKSGKLKTKSRTRLTQSNGHDQKLNDSTVQLPTAILQSEDFVLPKFTLEMSVTETSSSSEALFIPTPMMKAAKSNKVNINSSACNESEPTPTTVIMKNDSVSMNTNENSVKPQTNLNDNSYKFSGPDMILDESVQNSSLLPNYIFGSPEQQTIVQLKENEKEKEKNIDKGKKEEKEEKESGKLIALSSENKTEKWKCDNCPNNTEFIRCICCGTKKLEKSKIENNQCSECKIAFRQEHTDKCIECEIFAKLDKVTSKLSVPNSLKWKCKDCLVENDRAVKKYVCFGNRNPLSCVGNSKSDEWKCENCWIKNKNNIDNCVACGGPKVVSKETTSKDVVQPSSTANTVTNDDVIFKKIMESQSDRWECANCLVCNDNKKNKCACCDAARPGTYKEAEKKCFNFSPLQNTTFKFGINPNENVPSKNLGMSSAMQLEITVTESETNNNIVPKPVNFNFGISKPNSRNNIMKEQSIAEDRTPSPEEIFKFGTSESLKTPISTTTLITTANVLSDAALSATKYTESVLTFNSKETDEKLREVPNIEEPHASLSVNTPKPGELFDLPLNNSSAESSMPALINFGTAGQSCNKQAKQAVATTDDNRTVCHNVYNFTAANIPALTLFSASSITTPTPCILFSTAPSQRYITTENSSHIQEMDSPQNPNIQDNKNQTLFPQSTLPSFNENKTMTTTAAASSNAELFSFGGNNQSIQAEKPKFNFTFGNKSELPSLFASPMSNNNNTMSGNVLPENKTVSGTVISGENGLATGNSTVGGNGLPSNSLSSGLLAGPAKKDGMWPSNSDLNSFKMTSGTSVETSGNNFCSIQSGSLFENQWLINQNSSNDSLSTLKLSADNNLEPVTDPLSIPTSTLFGAPETKDTMWSTNNNISNNIFGTHPSTNDLHKTSGFAFDSSTMQFNGNNMTPPTFGSSIQPAQNIFGISNQNNNATLFSNPIQHQPPPAIFGQPQQINNSTPVDMFGAPGVGVAGNPRFGTPNQPISAFEAPQLNPIPTQTFNFGAQQTTGVFGFGQQQQQQQSGVYKFGSQTGQLERLFNIGIASAPNTQGRRVIRKAVRRTTQR